MKPSNIILITSAFPADNITEPVFIMPELRALSRKFKSVTVMPMLDLPELPKISLREFDNVTVSMALARDTVWKHKWMRAMFLPHPAVLKAALSGKVDEVTYAAAALTVRRAVKRLKLDPEDTLLYSYWFEAQAVGAALSPVPTIIRAHGHDVWTERGHRLRAKALSKARALYAVSESCAAHIRKCYPEHAEKVTVSRLGSIKLYPEAFSAHHKVSERKLTFITCARCSPEKRIPLTYEFVKSIATARPDTEVKWLYIGDGPEMDTLRKAMEADEGSANFKADLRGSLPNGEVQKLYATEAIDWNIMLSSSEGLGIALCESLSYGVPVIATEVGGIPEIIDDSCGILLPAEPEKEELVRGIAPYIDSEFRMDSLRQGARERWSSEADALRLSKEFAERLSDIPDHVS